MHADDSSTNNDAKHVNMNDSAQNSQAKNDITNVPSFFDRPKNIRIIMYSFYALCIILVALDFLVHRHIYLSFEKIPAFYAMYGFVACVMLVVVAKLMRIVVMRDEHYYDKRLDEHSGIEQTSTVSKTTARKVDDNIGELSESIDELSLSRRLSPGDEQS
jgi:hypothetical protein